MVTLSIKKKLNKACFLDMYEEHGSHSHCYNGLFSNNLIIPHSLSFMWYSKTIGANPTHTTDNKQKIFVHVQT